MGRTAHGARIGVWSLFCMLISSRLVNGGCCLRRTFCHIIPIVSGYFCCFEFGVRLVQVNFSPLDSTLHRSQINIMFIGIPPTPLRISLARYT